MRQKSVMKRLNYAIVAILLLSFFIATIPSSKADLDYLVQLEQTSGPPGNKIYFQINIQNYFALKYPPGDSTITTQTWEDFIGKRFVLLWDMDGSEEYQPQYWNVIGDANVDYTGLLWGEATIPNAVPGHHTISAVYENNDQYYLDWWTAPFTVTEGGSGNPGDLTGTTSGDGSTPGFELCLMLGALIAVVVWKKQTRK
jgi:hypothetical protein